jgi:hypothetical protein
MAMAGAALERGISLAHQKTMQVQMNAKPKQMLSLLRGNHPGESLPTTAQIANWKAAEARRSVPVVEVSSV